jgi:hypothetical protein
MRVLALSKAELQLRELMHPVLLFSVT